MFYVLLKRISEVVVCEINVGFFVLNQVKDEVQKYSATMTLAQAVGIRRRLYEAKKSLMIRLHKMKQAEREFLLKIRVFASRLAFAKTHTEVKQAVVEFKSKGDVPSRRADQVLNNEVVKVLKKVRNSAFESTAAKLWQVKTTAALVEIIRESFQQFNDGTLTPQQKSELWEMKKRVEKYTVNSVQAEFNYKQISKAVLLADSFEKVQRCINYANQCRDRRTISIRQFNNLIETKRIATMRLNQLRRFQGKRVGLTPLSIRLKDVTEPLNV